jgi:benzoylformate decarboxylase
VTRARNGAQFAAGVLASAGVDTIFGLPGSTEASLLETLRERTDLRYVLGLHEGVVVSMADGYARVTGRPGVVGLHTTVGTLNGASQIYNAYRDRSPVVVTAGHKDRTVLSEDGFCAHPHLPEAVRPFTKWAHQTLIAAELGSDLWRALHIAMTPPAGPTYLAMPEDFLRGPVPAEAPDPPVSNSALWKEWAGRAGAAAGGTGWPAAAAGGTGWSAAAAGGAVPDDAQCAAAAALLAGARWPVVVMGSEARGCVPQLRALADRLAAPLVFTDFTDLADLPFPTADPRYFGLYGEDPAVLDGCDLVFAVGSRVFFPFSAARHPRLPEGARLVHVHPDAAQVGARLPTAAGIVASPAAVLRALAPHLDRAMAAVDPAATAARVTRLAALRAGREEQRRAERATEAAPMTVEAFAAELGQVLPADVIIADEGVRSSTRLLRHLDISDGQLLLRSSGGALGWGVPAAVGACLGRPGRPVLAVVGDGSYHFSVQAIWTAVQQQASLVVVVLDNGGYLAVKRAIEGYLGLARDPRAHPGTRLPAIDHVAVAAGYGAGGVTVGRRGEVGAAVKEAFAAGGVRVIAVPVAEVRP